MTQTSLPFNASPKAVLAFLFPLIAAIGVSVANWIATGEFDANSVRLAAGGAVTACLAALGAYVGRPGDVVPNVGAGSDALLGDTAKRLLDVNSGEQGHS